MGNNWKKQLREQLKAAEAGRDTDGMERTIAAVQEEYGKTTDALLRGTSLASRKKRERIGFGEFLLLQIRFTGWKIWILQAVLFGAAGIFLSRVYGDIYQINKDKIPFLLCCCAVMIAMTAIPFLQRSLRCRMYETEAASRMSAGKLLASWIVLAGVGDMAGLLMLLVLTVRKTPLEYGSAVLYLAVPFLAAAAVLFYLLVHLKLRYFSLSSVCVCAALLLVFGICSEYYPVFFRQTFTAGWGLVCLCLLAFMVRQYGQLHRAFALCGI